MMKRLKKKEVETDGEDDTSTQEPEIYTADDLDLDAQVAVKIDGEESAVSFGDLIKVTQLNNLFLKRVVNSEKLEKHSKQSVMRRWVN